MTKPNVTIIGPGKIGTALYDRVTAEGWNIPYVIDFDGVFPDVSKKSRLRDFSSSHLQGLSLAFLCIPTLDDGKIAFNYISQASNAKVPIVTCEKGALGNYFPELEHLIKNNLLGYSAVVGAGSRLLRHLHERSTSRIEEIHAVVNGTLNYIFDRVSRGESLGEAAIEAARLGYTESGSQEILEIINRETRLDIPLKTSALFNIANLTPQRVRARDIETRVMTFHDLRVLEKQAEKRRYIVSITKSPENNEDILLGFKMDVGDWHISAGFKNLEENPLYKQLIPQGVDNSLITCEGEFGGEGIYRFSGPGAGPGPTATSMLADAERMLFS